MAGTNYEERFTAMRKRFENDFSMLYHEVRMDGWEWDKDEDLDQLLDEMQDDLAEFDAAEDEEE